MKIGGVGGVKSRSESCLQVLCLDRRKVRVKWGSYRTPANTSQTGIPMSCSTSGHNSFFLFFKKNTYLCVWLCQVLVAGCSMGDIVAWAGIEPGSPASWTWSLSHWTTGDVPTSPSWHPSSETAILPNTKLFLCSLFCPLHLQFAAKMYVSESNPSSVLITGLLIKILLTHSSYLVPQLGLFVAWSWYWKWTDFF